MILSHLARIQLLDEDMEEIRPKQHFDRTTRLVRQLHLRRSRRLGGCSSRFWRLDPSTLPVEYETLFFGYLMGRWAAPQRSKVRVLGDESIETHITHRDTDFPSSTSEMAENQSWSRKVFETKKWSTLSKKSLPEALRQFTRDYPRQEQGRISKNEGGDRFGASQLRFLILKSSS